MKNEEESSKLQNALDEPMLKDITRRYTETELLTVYKMLLKLHPRT